MPCWAAAGALANDPWRLRMPKTWAEIRTRSGGVARVALAPPGMKIPPFRLRRQRSTNAYLPATLSGDPLVVLYAANPRQPTCLSWWQDLSEDAASPGRRLKSQHIDAPAGSCWNLALGSRRTGHCSLRILLHLDDRAPLQHAWNQHGNWCWAAGAAHRCACADPCQGLGELARRYGREHPPAGERAALSSAAEECGSGPG